MCEEGPTRYNIYINGGVSASVKMSNICINKGIRNITLSIQIENCVFNKLNKWLSAK